MKTNALRMGLIGTLLMATAAPLLAKESKAEVAPYKPPTTVPVSGIGHRWDGHGVYPADFKPPTSFDQKTGRNIRWKAKLPNWGYGAPVPVGNRVLFMTDADARFIWPVLYCFDAETGKRVWSAPINPLDAFGEISEAERQRVTKTVEKLWGDNRALYIAARSFEEANVGAAGPDDPILVETNRKLADRGIHLKRYRRGYGALRYAEYPDGYDKIKKDLWKKYNIQPNLYYGGEARTGDAFGTPVCDGRVVYVNTIHGAVDAQHRRGPVP